ncbi:hypothetical protein, partial [Salmonella sp. SAL4433]|uniref:hypothetical protein n=1 Tax=Salmonella sp. SAL4433 TaxID=3159888 RepID=UPI00397C83EA
MIRSFSRVFLLSSFLLALVPALAQQPDSLSCGVKDDQTQTYKRLELTRNENETYTLRYTSVIDNLLLYEVDEILA